LGEFEAHLASNRPVVFVGPFEHHSNEISWRQCMCTVVEVDLSAEGNVDLDHLQRLLQDPAYDQPGRLRFVSMSAASNVTGIIAPVHDIARIAHAHGAFALFDFAASAPYVRIDMNPLHDPAASLDAVFISPHKFLGGPGACGVLVFNKRMYHGELSPSVAGGGTVTYVTHTQEDYVADVEEREKAGTPGILQTLRAGLAMELKTLVGEDNIQRRELVMLKRAFARWNAHSGVSILGNLDPEKRVGIVSFNVRDPRGRFLHFRLVGALLNDLFGIQSRAGCSCAAPYGHRLLQIDEAATDKLRTQVRHGFNGIKPGWVRVGFHYSMTDEEVDFIIQAVCFVADFGARFIPLYEFNKNSGRWVFAQPLPGPATSLPQFGVANALKLWRTAPPKSDERMSDAARAQAYQAYMSDATKLAERLPEPSPIMAPMCSPAMQQPDEDWKALMFFNLS
jgi:selenocysteine lyase/cysteine desulfurase